jgi:putative ABC transport system permease protein
MTLLHRARSIVRWIAHRNKAEQDLDDEMQAFVEMAAADQMREGATPGEAHRLALLQLGGVEQAKERVRTGRHGAWLDDLGRDVRYGLRQVRRNRAFSAIAIATLALGIGVNTAMFSIFNAVLLRPLPFEEPERLVRIFTKTPDGRNFELSPGKFYSWQRNARSFEDMAMSSGCGFRELALTGTGAARLVRATAVSAGFFEIVRARPALGRVFRQEEDTPGGRHVVILSDRFWKTELGGAPDVLGRTLKLSDEAYTIVGVMPAGASVASWPAMACDIWIPLALTDKERAARGNHYLDGVARLNAGVGVSQAQSEMNAILTQLAREFPKWDGRGWGALIIPMQEEIVGEQTIRSDAVPPCRSRRRCFGMWSESWAT